MARRAIVAVILLLVMAAAVPGEAKEVVLPGVIAASVGNDVVLADPGGGGQVALPAGPVAWLFPAPGGVLFAPDLVNGKTTVVDLKTMRIRDRLEAVTMPHFGAQADRYVALVGELLVLSYPERAVLARVDAGIEHPWQVLLSPDDATVLILERRPDGKGGASLVAVNLPERRVALRRGLGTDVVRMALSEPFGLLALAEPTLHRVVLVEPGTVAPVAEADTGGAPADLAFVGEDRLLTATSTASTGLLQRWRLRRHHGSLALGRHGELALPAPPVRMALAPDGATAAVALADGTVELVDAGSLRKVGSLTLPGPPRDLRWCDPNRPGPLLPEWSDAKPEPLPPLGTEHP